jgi:hypothetical protein
LYLDVFASDLLGVFELGVLASGVNKHQVRQDVLVSADVLSQTREETKSVVRLGEGKLDP